MDADLKEAVARTLYEQWCDDFGNPSPPEWAAYESNADINGVGLRADSFRDDAEAIAPFDSAEAVARRMCFNNGIPECHGHKGTPCTEVSCEGWREWLPYAEQVVSLANVHATQSVALK